MSDKTLQDHMGDMFCELNARDDWGPQFSHVSDLGTTCDRQVWHRRRGDTPLPFDADSSAKMEYGRRFQRDMQKALDRAFPGQVDDEVRIVWNPATGECRETLADPTEDEMVGHIDHLHRGVKVVESKQTSHYAFSKGVPREDRIESYREQLSGYVTATRLPGELYVSSRDKVYPYGPIDVPNDAITTNWATQRGLEMLAKTHPSAPAPPAIPNDHSKEFACDYCPFAQCIAHPQYKGVKDAATVT